MRFVIIFFITITAFAQTDEKVFREIYTNSLTQGKSYEWLDYLSNQIGGRLSGSLNAERAVNWTKSELELLGLDKVWLQPVMVPKWVRGAPECLYRNISRKNHTGKHMCTWRFDFYSCNGTQSKTS